MGSNVVKGSKRATPGKPPVTSQDCAGPDPASSDGLSQTGPHGEGSHASLATLERPLVPVDSNGTPARVRVPQPHGGVLAMIPPGVSGNPGGRPRTKPLEAALRQLVDGEAGGIAKALVDAAKAGDVNAAKVVIETLYGKPTQRIEVDTFAKAYDVTMDVDNV